MKFSESIKPISYIKAHASEIIRDIVDNKKPVIITQNGEAKVILQDIIEYEKNQESLALLKILALSSHNLNQKNTKTAEKSFKDLRKRIKEHKQ